MTSLRVTSSKSIITEYKIKVTRVEEIVINWSRLLIDVQILLSLPWEVYKEHYKEYAFWYWAINC